MAKPTGISFINRIDSILKQQNRTRKSLCDDLEILPCTMATWKTKNILPSIDTAYKIAEHLNVSLDWLLTGKIITENSNSFTDNLNKLNEGNFALIKNLVNSLIDKQEYQQLSDSLIQEKGNKMNRRNVTAMTSNNNQEDYRCQKS